MLVADLTIRFIPQADITSELQNEIDALDKLAFVDDGIEDDPEFASIQWSTPDWMALGYLNKELVTQLCLPKREISVGGEKVWVAGVGGMATHPNHQRKGYGSTLLEATGTFMRDEMQVPFGLLICADETRPFYEHAGWRFAAGEQYYIQDNQRRIMHTCVMFQALTKQSWRVGEINLSGLPW